MTLATSSPIHTPDLLWPFPFGQMDWAVTPPAVQDYIETLQGRVAQLQKQVETLTGRLEKTSQTSSKPPSSDSPFNKPKRKRQKSKGGKRGARTGHRGTGPTLLSPTEVHWVEPAPCRSLSFIPIAPKRPFRLDCGGAGHLGQRRLRRLSELGP